MNLPAKTKELKRAVIDAMLHQSYYHSLELNNALQAKDTQISNLEANLQGKISHIGNLEAAITERDVQISHLESLSLGKEATLNHIYDSHGWKALLIYYRLRDKIITPGSKRRNFAKRIISYFDQIIRTEAGPRDSLFNIKNLNKFFWYCRTRGIRSALSVAVIKLKKRNNSRRFEINPVLIAQRNLVCFGEKLPLANRLISIANLDKDGQGNNNIKRTCTVRKYKVIFLIGCLESESKRYRVFNLMEAFKLNEVESDFFLDIDIPTKLEYILSYDVIVLFRASLTKNVETLIKKANALNIPIIFDVDDYVFEPAIIPYLDGIKSWSIEDKKEYEHGVLGYRQTLEHCDYVTAPTSFLVEKASKLGKKTYVIKNTLNQEQIEICEKVLESKGAPGLSKGVRIGYFSGTKTHQKDFTVAYMAILKILNEFSDVKLLVVGYLDLDEFPEFREFEYKNERIAFVDWKRLPYEIGSVDINIIPLELNNPFCDAKSELKYFEAGALKIPSVASPTRTFREVIKHGENGFLAETADDWYGYLKDLIVDEDLRKKMGENAYKHTMDYYTPAKLSSDSKETYNQIIMDFRKVEAIRYDALSITFVVPPPTKGSGGHNKIFSIAAYLSNFGHHVRVYVTGPTPDFKNSKQLTNFIREYFNCSGFDVILGIDNILSCDALIATHWTTAYVVSKYQDRAFALFYFIQDYEPLFYPMGNEYLKAENTYRLGLHHISIGPWCANLLRKKYDVKADWIPFPLDRNIYKRNVGESLKKRIIFFARPEMPRRCFDLGAEALSLFHKKHPEVEIALFGSNKIHSSTLNFPHKNLGVLPPNKLAELYSTSYLGIAFSTTNPSLVPYEMMACKCPVIDLDYNENEINYGSRENVMLVGISPEEIADGIGKLMGDIDLKNRIAENGFLYVQSFPDDETFSKRFEQIITVNIEQNYSVSHKKTTMQKPSAVSPLQRYANVSRLKLRTGPSKKLKVLLIYPPLHRFYGLHDSFFPLGLGYLASVLDNNGFHVRIYNMENPIEKLPLNWSDRDLNQKLLNGYQYYVKALQDSNHPVWQEMRNIFQDEHPDVIGVSARSPAYPSTKIIAQSFKEINPKGIAILGGPHATLSPNEVMEEGFFDFLIRGEGEQTILELCNRIEERETDFHDISGISLRTDEMIKHNPPRKLIENIDDLPYPAKNLSIFPERYPLGAMSHIVSSRGCPFHCGYCAQHKIWTRKVRYQSIERTLGEIRELQSLYTTNFIYFWDDTFTVNPKRVVELCETLIKRKIAITWNCTTRVDLVDAELLELMHRAGCRAIDVGIESGSERILKLINKSISLDEVHKAVDLIKNAGIQCNAFFMLGFPQETEEDIQLTLQLIRNIRASIIAFSIFTPYPGCSLFETTKNMGLLPEKINWAELSHHSAKNYFVKNVPKEKFEKIILEATRLVDEHNRKLS